MEKLIEELIAFRDARDWEQFHTPRNLAVAISIEASELQETMLWQTDSEVGGMLASLKGKTRVRSEIADVLIFALLFCESVGVVPEQAIREKIQKNHEKYPIALSRGNSTKYDELKGSQ